MQEQYRQQQEQQQYNASQNSKATPKPKKEVGEYIDYEEVK